MNPYLFSLSDIGYLRYNYKVFCLRYGVEVTKGLHLGSQYFFIGGINDFFQVENKTSNLGIFGKYDLISGENVGLLLETAFHYKCEKYKDHSDKDSGKRDGIGWYTSAGMGINLYKKKVTLDLMVKYSPDVMFEGNHFAPTYKLNYHFK
ncbi:MAG TPA: hypothetical protein DCL86_15360 [Bacteroidales bacterium]|jgi:hypothetical protein|nr:hypothetical protein [Bacteroidales bacterium]